MTYSFQIDGPPRTKKTSNDIVRAGGFARVLPSKAYRAWFDATIRQAFVIRELLRQQGAALPISGPVAVQAIFYLGSNIRGDLTGYMQALADWMQAARNGAGIIGDDKQIQSWDGSRVRVDRARPRIEVRIAENGWRA